MNNHECVIVLEVAWILKRFEVGHKTRRDKTRPRQDKTKTRDTWSMPRLRWLTLSHYRAVVVDVCESRGRLLSFRHRHRNRPLT